MGAKLPVSIDTFFFFFFFFFSPPPHWHCTHEFPRGGSTDPSLKLPLQNPRELSRVGFPGSLGPLASPTSPLTGTVWQRSWFCCAGSKHLLSLVAGLPGFLAASLAYTLPQQVPLAALRTPPARGGGEQESVSLLEMRALQAPASPKGDPPAFKPPHHIGNAAPGSDVCRTACPRRSGPLLAPWPSENQALSGVRPFWWAHKELLLPANQTKLSLLCRFFYVELHILLCRKLLLVKDRFTVLLS